MLTGTLKIILFHKHHLKAAKTVLSLATWSKSTYVCQSHVHGISQPQPCPTSARGMHVPDVSQDGCVLLHLSSEPGILP